MIVKGCKNCPFQDSQARCNLKERLIPWGVDYPKWCPLLSGGVTVILREPKVLPPKVAKEIEENIVRGLDDTPTNRRVNAVLAHITEVARGLDDNG